MIIESVGKEARLKLKEDEEYGRIASDGEIVEVLSDEKDFGENQIFLVSVNSIRANIVVTRKEMRRK